MSSRTERQRLARRWATLTFVLAIASALLAVWLWDERWLATAGVLLFAALVAATIAAP